MCAAHGCTNAPPRRTKCFFSKLPGRCILAVNIRCLARAAKVAPQVLPYLRQRARAGAGCGRGRALRGRRREEGAALHAAVAPGQLRAGVLWCAPGAAGLQPRGNPPISGVLRTPTLPPGPVLVASAPIRTTIWDPLSAKGRTPAALYSEAAFDLV